MDKFADAARNIKVGNGLEPDTRMGPMANARRIAAMERLTKNALSLGSRLLAGGKRLNQPGFFWTPTVLVDVPDEAEVFALLEQRLNALAARAGELRMTVPIAYVQALKPA